MTTNGNEKRPLPDGWKWTTLADVCHIELGQSPPSSTYNTDGIGLPFFQGKAEFGDLSPTPVKWCSEPKKIAEAGDVLISVRAPVGSTNLNREKSCIGRGLAAIRPNAGMSNLYFLYLLRLIKQELIDKATGTTFQAISGKVLREQLVPVAPPAEQECIVAEIEKQFTRLDTAVSTLNRLQSNLDRYQASLLKAACTGQLLPQDANDEPAERLLQRILAERRQRWLAAEWQNQIERAQKKAAQAQRKAAGRPHHIRDLDPADWQILPEAEYAPYLPKNDKWQKKYKEPAAVETADLPDLPPGWVWARIEQLSTLIQYGTSDKASVDNTGVPVLRMGNIQAGELDFGDLKYMPEDWRDIDKFLLEDGDLIFNRTNSAELVGKTAVYKKHHPQTTFASYLIRVQFANGVLPDFVSFYINSIFGRMYIASVVSQQVGQANVNGTKLANMPVPLPPLAEQKRIVEEVERRLSVITATQQAIRANQTRSGRLRQSILQQAFNGRLV
jgi:type I restriction enzyme, S subunit